MIDLSIVIPFFHKENHWKKTIKYNSKYLSNNRYEVIIVIDHPIHHKNMINDLIQGYSEINWKIVVNNIPHQWRPPSIPINVGIRYSCGEHILVVSPESIFATNVPEILLQFIKDNPNTFSCGHFREIKERDLVNIKFEKFDDINNKWYQSICFKKSDAESIHGYDETLTHWGGDDDNFRTRLSMNGCNMIYCEEACTYHLMFNEEEESKILYRSTDLKYINEIYYPKQIIANSLEWGIHKNFEEVINYSNGFLPETTEKIIILGSPRSGTHHLSGILGNNGYENFGELRLNQKNISIKDINNLLYMCASFYGKHAFIIHKTVLSKMFPELDINNWKTIIKEYFGEKSIYIRMQRSAIESAISYYFATYQNKWIKLKDSVDIAMECPPYNFDKIFEYLQFILNYKWTEEDKIFLNAYDVVYEDLCSKPEEIFDNINKKFKLNLTKIENNYCVKQENINKWKYIELFCDDLSKHLTIDKEKLKSQKISDFCL